MKKIILCMTVLSQCIHGMNTTHGFDYKYLAKLEHPFRGKDDRSELEEVVNLLGQCPLTQNFLIDLREKQCTQKKLPYMIAIIFTNHHGHTKRTHVDAHALNTKLFKSYKNFVEKKQKLITKTSLTSPVDGRPIIKIEYFITFKDHEKFAYLTSLDQFFAEKLPRGMHGIFACQDPNYDQKLPIQSQLRCNKLCIMPLPRKTLINMCEESDISHQQFCKLIHNLFNRSKGNVDKMKTVCRLILYRCQIAIIFKNTFISLVENLLFEKNNIPLIKHSCLKYKPDQFSILYKTNIKNRPSVLLKKIKKHMTGKNDFIFLLNQIFINTKNISHLQQVIDVSLRTLYPREKKYDFESYFDSSSGSDHSSLEEEKITNSPLELSDYLDLPISY